MTSFIVESSPSSAAEVQEVVRAAIARSAPLRVRGAGSWMDAGAPVAAAETLPLGRLSGIVEYVPGDLTLTALAATPLSEIARVTGAEGQWLALDPPGSEHGTIGATVATGSNGPLAAGFGSVRDAVLGVEVVTGRGALVRGGGRVVKNVAGFDLCRLFTGAWGTLGVLTEVTVRLRALPEQERSFAIAFVDRVGIDHQLARLRNAPFTPHAAQLLSPALAQALHVGDGQHDVLVVRLGGNSEALAGQQRFLGTLGMSMPVPDVFWSSLRTLESEGAAVLRLSRAPARLGGVWQAAAREVANGSGALMHACVVRGVVRVMLPHGVFDAASVALLRHDAITVVAERAPAGEWHALRPAEHAGDLHRRVRAAFDPQRLLNRGILGEES